MVASDRSLNRRGVSMLDVARAAGVSQKTVSRVVNDEPHVTEEVRRRVLAAIRELGFRPNAAARALASQRTRRIGMVTIGTSLYGPSSILDGVDAAARAAAGYSLSVTRTRENTVDELGRAMDTLVAEGVDGIIVSEPGTRQSASARGPLVPPILWFDSPDDEHEPIDIVVGTDEVAAAREATELLLELGHRSVIHIAGGSDWSATERRERGWRSALAARGIPVPLVLAGDWTARSGYQAMSELLAREPVGAVFAANDQMAVGAMHAIETAGLTVPGDVSVVGFDDDPLSEYLHTPLTTVRQDFEEATRIGMALFVDVIEGRSVAERHVSLPGSLIIRRSTGPAVD